MSIKLEFKVLVKMPELNVVLMCVWLRGYVSIYGQDRVMLYLVFVCMCPV